MHKVEVSLHVNIEISEDKKVTLGNISTAIKGLGIESKIAEQIILHKVVDAGTNKTFKPPKLIIVTVLGRAPAPGQSRLSAFESEYKLRSKKQGNG